MRLHSLYGAFQKGVVDASARMRYKPRLDLQANSDWKTSIVV